MTELLENLNIFSARNFHFFSPLPDIRTAYWWLNSILYALNFTWIYFLHLHNWRIRNYCEQVNFLNSLFLFHLVRSYTKSTFSSGSTYRDTFEYFVVGDSVATVVVLVRWGCFDFGVSAEDETAVPIVWSWNLKNQGVFRGISCRL